MTQHKHSFSLPHCLRLAQAGGKYHSYLEHLPRYLKASVQHGKSSGSFLALIALVGCTHPLHADTAAGKPSKEEALIGKDPSPYHLPTYTGEAPPLNHKIQAYKHAPRLDTENIYKRILGCYPAKSKWKIDVALQGAIGLGTDIAEDTSIGSNYAKIVASMPLYSATEMDRAMKNEHDLRQQTAEGVSTFVLAISDRNHALRKIALYTSLERRSSIRVQAGVAITDEQVKHLENVAKAHESLNKANAALLTTRLSLAAMCAGNKHAYMSQYLKAVSMPPPSEEALAARKAHNLKRSKEIAAQRAKTEKAKAEAHARAHASAGTKHATNE